MVKNLIIQKSRREGLLYQNLIGIDSWVKSHVLSFPNWLSRKRKIQAYFKNNPVRKIQFGAGATALKGFLNTDLMGEIPVDITTELPFGDDSVDLFYSNHLVEHILNRDFEIFLKETFRCLKPGGIHIVATPSLEKLVRLLYEPGHEEDRGFLLNYHAEVMGEELDAAHFLNRFMHLNYGHKFLYDVSSLKRLAMRFGYSKAEVIENRSLPDDSLQEYVSSKDRSWDLETETLTLTK